MITTVLQKHSLGTCSHGLGEVPIVKTVMAYIFIYSMSSVKL